MGDAEQPKKEAKTLPVSVVNKFDSEIQKLDTVTNAIAVFKDDYAGNVIGGNAENLAGRLGAPGVTEGQAEWWQSYDRYKNQVRNELFGASLTAGEQAAFLSADIEPNMSPAVIKANLAKQKKVIEGAVSRKLKYYKSQGYGVGEYEQFLSGGNEEAGGKSSYSTLWGD